MTPDVDDDLIAKIRSATDGLFYVSETDAPFEIVEFGFVNGNSLPDYISAMGKSSSDLPEQVSPEEFFSRLTRIESWFTETERERAGRYAVLWQLLQSGLEDIRVLRFGKIRIEIFVVGRAKNSGKLIGIKTVAVET